MTGTVAIIGVLAFLLNVPLGMWRAGAPKFSVKWFVAIHASVPFIAALRIFCDVSPWFIPLFLALAITGQIVGSRIRRPAIQS